MEKYQGYSRILATGAPAPNATVTVYYPSGTLTLASIYSDDGVTPKANPFTADADGYFSFYAAAGDYDVRLSGGGIVTPYTWGDITIGANSGAIPVNTQAALSAAITTLAGSPGTLLISTNVAITSSVTVPSNVSLWVISPGQFTISSGQTLTVQGTIIADRHRIFAGSGSPNLVSAKLDWVYPEWWGAVTLKAASGTPVDSTTALQAACASGRNVSLDNGMYGTTAELLLVRDGQGIQGMGIQTPVDGIGGTTIKRLSGTDYIVRGGSYIGTWLDGVVLDGGGLSGSVLRWESFYSVVSRIRCANVGGTSFAIQLSGINLCTFRDILVADTCYAGIWTNPSNQVLYSQFITVSIGETTGAALDIENATGLNFYGLYCDGKIYVHGSGQSNHFTDTRMETGGITSGSSIEVTGAGVVNTVFRGLRIYRNAANTDPEIVIGDGTKVAVFSEVYYQDLFSAATRVLFHLNGSVYFCDFRNLEYYTLNALRLFYCSGGRSDNTTVEHVYGHSGAIGTMSWWAGVLTVKNTPSPQSFSAASQIITLIDCLGAISYTNASYITLTNSGEFPIATFADGDTTPSIASSSYFQTANTAPTTITNFDDALTGTGVRIFIRFNDPNTTLDLSSNPNLIGNNGVDFTGAVGDWCTAERFGSKWYVSIYLG